MPQQTGTITRTVSRPTPKERRLVEFKRETVPCRVTAKKFILFGSIGPVRNFDRQTGHPIAIADRTGIYRYLVLPNTYEPN